MSDNAKQKKYVGFGKKVSNYDLINFSIPESKVKDSWYEYKGERYLRMTMGALKEQTQYGQTHNIWIDEFKPEGNKNQNNTTQAPKKEFSGDGLPF